MPAVRTVQVYHGAQQRRFEPFQYTIAFAASDDPSLADAVPEKIGYTVYVQDVYFNIFTSAAESVTIVAAGLSPLTVAVFGASTAVGNHRAKYGKQGFACRPSRGVDIVASGVGYAGTLQIVGYYVPSAQVVWTDDFSTPMSPLAYPWTGLSYDNGGTWVLSGARIADGKLRATNNSHGGLPYLVYYDTGLYVGAGELQDQSVEFDWESYGWDGIAILFRADGNGNGILLWLTISQPDADNIVAVYQVSDIETYVLVGASSTFADLAGTKRIRAECVGGADALVRFWIDNVLVFSQACTTAPLTGYVGFQIFDSDYNGDYGPVLPNLIDNLEIRGA